MQNHSQKMTLTAGLFLAGAVCAIAQTPSQTTPNAAPPPPRWESTAALGLTLTKGNSDTLLFTGKLGTQRKAPPDEWYFGIDGSYGKDHGDVNNETLHGFGQYNHLFSDRFYAYLKADGFHDGVADIKYRVTVSPGAGYYFIKNKTTSLSAEIGPGYIEEKVGGIERGYFTLRLAERFEHRLSDKARIWQSLEYLPKPDDFGDYLVNGELGVEASLAGNLALQVYLQDYYNSRPAAGRDANDLRLVSALAYKL